MAGLQIQRLKKDDSAEFCSLTYPSQRWLLLNPGPEKVIAVGVRSGQDPVGLALAHARPMGFNELVSLYINPLFDSPAVRNKLLAQIEKECSAAGLETLQFLPVVWEPSIQSLEWLIENGWTYQGTRQLVCKAPVDNLLAIDWLQRPQLPAGYQCIPWSEVSDSSRQTLKDSQPHWPSLLDPFYLEKDHCDTVSQALLDEKSRIRGWLITHGIDAQILRWTASWVDPQIQSMTRVFPLWRNAAEAQKTGSKHPLATWTVPIGLDRMQRFTLRRIRPHLTALGYATLFSREL